MLGTANRHTRDSGRRGGDPVGRRGHHLLQGVERGVLLVFDDAGLDGLPGSALRRRWPCLMTADADTVVIQTVYRKFNTLGLVDFFWGLKNWAIKLGCL